MNINNLSPKKIQEDLDKCEKQLELAVKNGNLNDALYWERKINAGKALIIMFPIARFAAIFIILFITFSIIESLGG